MANTISNISLANTFGDWVSTTVQTVNELNYIGNQDWYKDSGTLYISSNGTGLDVANSAFFRGAVSITGIGSSLNVQKNAAVQGVLLLTNTDTDANPSKLIFSANGVANINFLNVTGPGQSANVSNNMFIGGTLSVTGNTTLSANLTVSRDITSNNQTINYDLNVGEDVDIGRNLSVDGNTVILGTSTTSGVVYTLSDVATSGKTTSNNIVANNNIITNSLNSIGISRLDSVISNTHVTTPLAYVTSDLRTQQLTSNTNINVNNVVYTDGLQANTAANTRTLSVTGTASVDTLQANTLVNTPTVNASSIISNTLRANVSVNTVSVLTGTLNSSGDALVNNLQSNTVVTSSFVNVTNNTFTNGLQANTAANTRTLSVTQMAFVDGLQANTATNTRTLSVTGTASVGTLQANTLVNTPTVNTKFTVAESVISNSVAANTILTSPTVTISGTATVNNLQANTSTNTRTLSVTGTASVDTLQANTAANTRTLSVTGTASVDTLQANTAANTRTLSVSQMAFVDGLQANTATNTRTLSVTGTASVGTLQANTLVNSPTINTAYANVVNISVSDTATVGSLTSNTNIVANNGTIWSSIISAPNIRFTSSILGGTGSSVTASTGVFDNVTVQGNFTISGQTVYNSDTLTLNAAQTANVNGFFSNFRPNGSNAHIRWNETSKWWDVRDVENPTHYNRILTANDYTSINTSITTANTNLKNYVDVASSSLQTQVTNNAISANAVINTANTNLKNYVDVSDASIRASITSNVSTLNTTINNNAVSANAVINTANTNLRLYTNAQISANAVSANAVISKANTDLKNYTDSTFVRLTSSSQTLNGDLSVTGNLTVNGSTTTIDTQSLVVEDSLIQLAKDNTLADSLDIGFYGPYRTGGVVRYTGLFRKAADKYYLAQGIVSDPTSNNVSDFGASYRATLDANFTGGTVSGLSSAIAVADGGTGTTTSTGTGSVVLSASPTLTGTPIAPTAANGTFSTQLATTAFVNNANGIMRVYVDGINNNLQTQITNNASSANAVINTVNTNLRLYVDSNINSNVSTLSSNISSLQVQITSLQSDVANNAVSANAVITTANTSMKTYVDTTKVSSVSGSSGRISSTGGLTPVLDLITTGVTAGVYGGTSTVPVITVDSYGRLTSSANLTLNLSSITGTLPIGSGGTGATSQSQALTNLLPTGTTAGYVLTTGGPGNFYWAAGGTGGGGGTPGTTINTTRLSYTATAGQRIFTAPTYVPGTGQLRVYINGVRQFPSEYVETNATTVTLTVGANLNDVVFVEVDGYINNPYFANNITFTAPFGGIVSTANTIQLAIQDLESRKATLVSPALTGTPTAPTPTAGNNTTSIATTAFVQTANTNMKTYVDGRFAANVVTANVTSGSIGVGTTPSGVAGEIRATNNITAYYSDERLKTNLGPITGALDKVNSLNGFYHEANELAQSLGYVPIREVGVSAQEVQSVLPEVVAPAPIDDKYLTVRYERLVPLLIEAIKELNSKVEQLQQQIDKTRQ